MEKYCIEPKSRKDLRVIAFKIRQAFGLEDCLHFPIVEFMEHMMPKKFDNFEWEIVEDDELPPNQDAVTVIKNGFGVVKIKQSVYDGACEGNGQHRMTIAHEIVGHFIPICILGFKLYVSNSDGKIVTFCNPEWQAKCLAGEFMMPYHLVKDYNSKQLERLCGVSKTAAKYQMKIFREELSKRNRKL